jgi:hypothetical protein
VDFMTEFQELIEAQHELTRIQDEQDRLSKEKATNPLAHIAYEMGTLVREMQVYKVLRLQKKCNII